MVVENDFLPFATGVGATVIDQPTYAAAPWVSTGFQDGIADPSQLNKVWRQSSMMAAALASMVVNQLGLPVIDDGNLVSLTALLTSAIQQSSTVKPSRIVTSSAGFTLSLSDYRVALNRTVAVAAQAIELPAGAVNGQEFVVEDIQGNFSGANKVTVSPPVGSISNEPTFVMNQDRQSALFAYLGTNIWSVKS